MSSSEVETIIGRLFKDADRIPVYDRMAYSLPVEFWKRIENDILQFSTTELQYTTLLRLATLANEYDFYDPLKREISQHLNLELEDVVPFLEKQNFDQYDIGSLNYRLEKFLEDNGLGIEIDNIRRNHRQRLAMKRRDIIRTNYIEYEEARTALAFQSVWKEFDFPDLMLDRVEIMVFSEEYFTFKKDVQKIIEDSKFSFSIDIDRAEYTRRDYLDAGYSPEEVDMYCPVNLDEQFDFVKNRSVLSLCSLTSKPKKTRDGSGWSYVWREEGAIYRYNYRPPKGRPVSLMMHVNMQRSVWLEIVKDHPEYADLYDAEFLKESNFIPTECVHLYKEYEKRVFDAAVMKANQVFIKMMEHNGFTGVAHVKKQFRILQCEVCWNQPMPVDPGTHLWLKYDRLRSVGLNPQIDADTPLLVTEFRSDVDATRLRYIHKEYRKSKKILRSEIILKGELKNRIDILGIRDIQFTLSMPSLSDYFLEDLDLIKKYLFFKLHRRYDQINGLLDHGYYNWLNDDHLIDDELKREVLQGVLDSFDDLPQWLKDVDLFDSLVDQEYLTKAFFQNLSERKYRSRVREDPIFKKISHGRYRLIHDAVPAYLLARQSLACSSKPTTDELLQS
ncbi:hypothetical protein [Methanolobus sp. WCC4]|uniref:hypothetical protein n=1 Tax=Methanolobus sp. WCC4 TaxID=3125784 RepID=UPI0030F86423